ncbi:hypothetical protein FB45DRAFT_1050213 [Roridomyces roridus]|uniref:Uncharacterized protein n=1 Tax=Roridomyces roridus TaxID=1738132 RepID=A0AAD7CIS5_9AGAR|nr:hypothetical protein FB45DRAFT_1050213 [Roridomyces roridus]
MALLGHVVGGVVFGLTSRFYQLGILKRPMMQNPAGHVACMVAGAGAGYWWWQATVYMKGVLAEKEDELRLRRQLRQAHSEEQLQAALESPVESLPQLSS